VPMKNPPHPGDFIRTEIIEPAGLSVTAAAIALQVSRPALSSLLNGKADLSGNMALRIEKAFGVRMDTLLRMQASYDIAQTREANSRQARRSAHSHLRPPLRSLALLTRRALRAGHHLLLDTSIQQEFYLFVQRSMFALRKRS
jgi:antitoxin HigA-1